MDRFTFDAAGEEATAALGAALAEVLPHGTTVALCGPLGAGKTRLVQAIARAAGVASHEVVSPTYLLIHEYQGEPPIYHIDAYRLRDEDEFMELGAEEYFESDGLVLIEWADRVEGCLPDERIEIRIQITGTHSRHIEIIGLAPRFHPVIERLQAILDRPD